MFVEFPSVDSIPSMFLPGYVSTICFYQGIQHLGVAQKKTAGANRRFWSMCPLAGDPFWNSGFLSHSRLVDSIPADFPSVDFPSSTKGLQVCCHRVWSLGNWVRRHTEYRNAKEYMEDKEEHDEVQFKKKKEKKKQKKKK